MTFLAYTTNIPFQNNDPSVDQPSILQNTNSINSIIAIDHHGFQDVLGGYHTIIHQDPQVSDPAAIAGINQIYVKNVTPATNPVGGTDTQLFARTGAGGISQLTGANTSVQGYQWVGNLLIQWGKVDFTGPGNNAGAVTFLGASSLDFPTQCLNVQTTVFYKTTPPASTNTAQFFIDDDSITVTGFKWAINSGAHGNMSGFFWYAIGF